MRQSGGSVVPLCISRNSGFRAASKRDRHKENEEKTETVGSAGYGKPTVDVSLLKSNPNDLFLFISGRRSSVRLRVHGQVTLEISQEQSGRKLQYYSGQIPKNVNVFQTKCL